MLSRSNVSVHPAEAVALLPREILLLLLRDVRYELRLGACQEAQVPPSSLRALSTSEARRLSVALCDRSDDFAKEATPRIKNWFRERCRMELVRLKTTGQVGLVLDQITRGQNLRAVFLDADGAVNVSTKGLERLGDVRDLIWRRGEQGMPLLLTVQRSAKGFLSAFCPACCRFHHHGSGAGHRAAHCVVKHWSGYVLDEPYLIVG